MNLTQNPTPNQLKQLLMACDDGVAHHIPWVDNDGNVYITPLPDDSTPPGFEDANQRKMKFRLETLCMGCGYVGPDAAKDQEWVNELFEKFTRHWEQGTQGYAEV